MDILKKILEILNNNTGVTLILSAIGFGLNEWYKTKNSKKLHAYNLKLNKTSPIEYEKQVTLYSIMTNYHINSDISIEFSIKKSEEIKTYIINENLHLKEDLSKLANQYADYILETGSTRTRDIKKEDLILKNYKKKFRN